jgi:hypothetical protein
LDNEAGEEDAEVYDAVGGDAIGSGVKGIIKIVILHSICGLPYTRLF